MTQRTDPTAAPLAQPGVIERRAGSRYACNLATSCRVLASIRFAAMPARVRNISAGGISLVVGQPVDPGSLLSIELRHTQRTYRRTLEVRVVYCIEHPNGEWIVGGSYTQGLSKQELAIFASGRLV